jgi:hypothetical protein
MDLGKNRIIGFTKDVYSQMLGRIRFSGTARMRMRVDRHQNESPLQYAMVRTWKCGESRLDYEWLIAAGGYSSGRHSVAWGERCFAGGRRISSLKGLDVRE